GAAGATAPLLPRLQLAELPLVVRLQRLHLGPDGRLLRLHVLTTRLQLRLQRGLRCVGLAFGLLLPLQLCQLLMEAGGRAAAAAVPGRLAAGREASEPGREWPSAARPAPRRRPTPAGWSPPG